VVVEDARSDKYQVGRIRIAPKARSAHYRIAAPLLTADSANQMPAQQTAGGGAQDAPYQPAQSDGGYQAPQSGPGYQAPRVGPGFVAPQVGPGFVQPGSQ
jgi:hypothetical protein